MFRIALILSFLFLAAAAAQTTNPNAIQATGIATIYVQPDQAQLTVSVSTNATTAQQAAQQNATQASAMLTALKQVLGTSGTIQTVGYSIYPQYSNGPNPSIVGYTASNTVQVTSYDLSLAGPLIDAAGQAGASSVGGLTFGLQNPDPAKQQALTAAAKQGLAHAAAIATGLGAHAGAVLAAQESVTSSIVVPGVAAGSSASTPVVSGTVSVSATVTVTVQLTP